MSLNFERVKHMNEQTKYVVFGYIRKSEQELLSIHDDDTVYIIPELVTMTCLLFYCFPQIFEQYSDKLHLSGWDNNTITKHGEKSWNNVAYGKELIDSLCDKVFSWELKINKFDGPGAIAIGIVSNEHHQDVDKDWDSSESWLITNGGAENIGGDFVNDAGFHATNGDKLVLTLDMKKGSLYYRMNDDLVNQKEFKYDLTKHKDVKYRLAVSIFQDKDCVTITARHS